MRKRGAKPRFRLSPIEQAYLAKYGVMPDYHYQRLKEQGMEKEKIAKTIQAGIDLCYEEMRTRHEKQEAIRAKTELEECPFYTSLT